MANKQNLDLNRYLPVPLKTELLTSLVDNLFNRFVSEEQSVFTSGNIGQGDFEQNSRLKALDLDRELNALVPALYVKTGAEENIFTFSDILNQLEATGVDVANMRSWLAERNYNFSPPIDYDRFVNYANYFWVGKTGLQPAPMLAWNPDVLPEYVTMSRPAPTSFKKLPVRLATVRNVSLFGSDRRPEVIKVRFTSAINFSVSITDAETGLDSGTARLIVSNLSAPANVPVQATQHTAPTVRYYLFAQDISSPQAPAEQSLDDTDLSPEPICSFVLANGNIPFEAGDEFNISITHLTRDIQVSTNLTDTGKGTLSGVISTAKMMSISGIQLVEGDRVLVRLQTNPVENGIYRVTTGRWTRTFDADTTEKLPNGTIVEVQQGQYTDRRFTLNHVSTSFVLDDPTLGQLTVTGPVSVQSPLINDWQLHNYWVHRNDLTSVGLNIDDVVQASRPIISFNSELQLSSYITPDGLPATFSDAGAIFVPQRKVNINQYPLFDLFWYDGRHARKVSPIFFFVEDSDFPIDTDLLRRAKVTENADFVFGLGITDDDGRLFFFKEAEQLETIWKEGVAGPTITNLLFSSPTPADKGGITVTLSAVTDNQQWTATAESSVTFRVVGSRAGDVGTVQVGGPPLVTEDLSVSIVAGAQPFSIGDNFKWTAVNWLAPRYVKKLDDGSIINFPGGPAADTLSEGTWLTPARMFQNLGRELQTEIVFGDLIDHFRGVMRAQDGFQGASFGSNNTRNLNFNYGLGGNIREFNSNFPLFTSLMIQDELSPLTIIDFGEQQYRQALSSIDQFILTELATIASAGQDISITGPVSAVSDPKVQALLAKFEQQRGADENLTAAFGDTTMLVTNWPVTLPGMGMLPAVEPTVALDFELGTDVIIHHDGHRSGLATDDTELNRQLTKLQVQRSDGSLTAGVFSSSSPPLPYAGQFWFQTSTGKLFSFNVVADTSTPPPTGEDGQYWYKRTTNQLYEWIDGAWETAAAPVSSRWSEVSAAAIKNSLVLAVETKLFYSIHPNQSVVVDLSSADSPELSVVELARYAGLYNLEPYATDFDASNPFTWNYSAASIGGVPQPTPARWFSVYSSYFDKPGVSLPTSRPDLEPWKLLNYSVKPGTWDATYASTVVANESLRVQNAKVATTANIALTGLQTIDGLQLTAGDRVLVKNQTLEQQNGIYVAAAGAWARAADSLQTGLTISVTNGLTTHDTTWVITTSASIVPGITPFVFGQVRRWLASMWQYIASLRPGLKLCVSPFNDTLLPPYIAPSLAEGAHALLNVIPQRISSGYAYGDLGPVELIWRKSLEFGYSMARNYFKLSPLYFLDLTWGEVYVSARPGGIRLEQNLLRPLPHTEFRLHGERNGLITERDPLDVLTVLSGGSITGSTSTLVRFTVSHIENGRAYFYAFIGDTLMGTIEEGSPFSMSLGTISFTDVVLDDGGIPFALGDELRVTFFDPVVIPGDTDTDGCIGCILVGAGEPGDGTTVQPVPEFEFTPAAGRQYKGLCQLFTNLLRYHSVDTDVSQIMEHFRGWDIRLTHRLGTMARGDSMSIDTSLGRLPDSSYSLLLKKSKRTTDQWISALRVQVVQVGASQTTVDNQFYAVGDASDWVFRVETYNDLHPFIEYYELDAGGPFMTFKALAGRATDREWRQYTEKVSRQTLTVPVLIKGLQNVVNLIFGYVQLLEEQGFKTSLGETPFIDQETGRTLTWQLEVEKLIDRVYSGIVAGQGHILNPFTQELWMSTPVGLMSTYARSKYVDATLSQAAYDVAGNAIPLDSLSIIRTDDKALTYSSNPIFSAHIFTDEFEHAVVFNQKVTDETGSPSIFSPFLGMYIKTAYLKYVKSTLNTLKPTFGGFFLSGNDVKRNITASIDNVQTYYDANRTFAEPLTASHSLALLGFSEKDYMNNLSISDTTQFNFWRGLIQAKGTNMSVDAFVNYRKFDDAKIDEYWAYKLAQYGDARERTLPEIKIGAADCRQKFTKLQFGDSTKVAITKGYQDIIFSAAKTQASPTGLPDTASPVFTAQVQVDFEAAPRTISVSGSEAQTFNELLSAINAALVLPDFTPVARADLVNGNIRVTSEREGANSTITIQPGTLFPAVAEYKQVGTSVEGAEVGYDELPLFIQIDAYDDSRWVSIDELGNPLKFEATPISVVVTVPSVSGGKAYLKLSTIFHNADGNEPLIVGPTGAKMVSSSVLKVTQPGTYTIYGFTWLKPTKLSPLKLIDYKENVIVREIGLWHPAIGIHNTLPLDIVDTISPNDPAKYSYSTQTTDNPTFNPARPWGPREKGRVWWDTSNLAYVPYYDAMFFPDRDGRYSRWGSLAEWASIDLYEWVESSVPPSEWDDKAIAEEGNYEIAPTERASGRAARMSLYARDRIIHARPIAWSMAAQGAEAAHPAFGANRFQRVLNVGSGLAAWMGRTADLGLTEGRHFGAWKNNKPFGEVSIRAELEYVIGSSVELELPLLDVPASLTGFISELIIEPDLKIGAKIGPITFSNVIQQGLNAWIRATDDDGRQEDIRMFDWAGPAGEKRAFTFDNFGITIVATKGVSTTIDAFKLSELLTASTNDVYIREIVRVDVLQPLPQESMFINDEADPAFNLSEYGWVAWNVPTQSQLDADLLYPRNSWQPYLGDEVLVEASAPVITEMKEEGDGLMLNSGISMKKYSSTWSDWYLLSVLRQEQISDGTTSITFTLDEDVDSTRASVYVNGIQISPFSYTIAGNTVTVLVGQTAPQAVEGATVTLIYRAYQPTEEELEFDPEVEDDVSIQTQYKEDYQYTVIEQRNEDGIVTSPKYYFWVEDKSIPLPGRTMSLQQAKEELKSGDDSFAMFSRLIQESATSAYFDSCAIANLGSVVTKDDSYKLRFTRDFTLRDDPEQMNLKNVHTEWMLIRKDQGTRIPKTLWDRLTDAVSGQDAIGNPLPDPVRVEYDDRNGTRSRFGFNSGQILADQKLVIASIVNAILNTELTITIGAKVFPDYIIGLDLDESEEWFSTADKARQTMDFIWKNARAKQINALFFAVLEDALANNYEFTDIFKTSFISAFTASRIEQKLTPELVDVIF